MVNLTDCDLVLFDLDGTLVDSVPDLAAAIDEMLRAHRLNIAGDSLVRNWVGNGAEKLVERALSWALSEKTLDKNSDFFKSAYKNFLTTYEKVNGDKSELYPGVLAALQHYRKQSVAMAIVTNKPLTFTYQLLDKLGVSGFFCDIAGGDSFANKKPHPQPLLELICRNNSTRPVMIGDSMHDVQAAKSAHIPVIAVSYGYNHGEDIRGSEPDLVIDSLTDLL